MSELPRIPFLGGDSVIVRRVGYVPVKLAVKLSTDSVYETLIVMQRDATKIILQKP